MSMEMSKLSVRVRQKYGRKTFMVEASPVELTISRVRIERTVDERVSRQEGRRERVLGEKSRMEFTNDNGV